MINITSTNTILYCRRWKETVLFYEALLNLPVITSLDWFIEFKISDSARLSIADESRTTIISNEGKGITITFEVADIHIAHSKIVQMGLKHSISNDDTWQARMIRVHDPEGNRVEFWSLN